MKEDSTDLQKSSKPSSNPKKKKKKYSSRISGIGAFYFVKDKGTENQVGVPGDGEGSGDSGGEGGSSSESRASQLSQRIKESK